MPSLDSKQFDLQYEDDAFADVLAKEEKEIAEAFPTEMPDSFYGVDDDE
jgi:hypothetical protein